MRSEWYLVIIATLISIFTSVISSVLIMGEANPRFTAVLVGGALIIGTITSTWHHKRVHRSLIFDTALLTMSLCLGLLTGLLAYIILAYLLSSLSSIPLLLALGFVSFLTAFCAVYVVARLASLRNEKHHHMLYGAIIIGLVVASVTVTGTYATIGSEVRESSMSHPTIESFYETLTDDRKTAYDELDGTPVRIAFDDLYERSAAELAGSLQPCEGTLIDLSECMRAYEGLVDAVHETVVRTHLASLIFDVSEENRSRTDAPALTDSELERLDFGYTASADFASMSFDEARAHYDSLDIEEGLFEQRRNPPVDKATSALMRSTTLGDMHARMAVSTLDRTAFYREYVELYVVQILLEENPRLTQDPQFSSMARELMAEYDAQRVEG